MVLVVNGQRGLGEVKRVNQQLSLITESTSRKVGRGGGWDQRQPVAHGRRLVSSWLAVGDSARLAARRSWRRSGASDLLSSWAGRAS